MEKMLQRQRLRPKLVICLPGCKIFYMAHLVWLRVFLANSGANVMTSEVEVKVSNMFTCFLL